MLGEVFGLVFLFYLRLFKVFSICFCSEQTGLSPTTFLTGFTRLTGWRAVQNPVNLVNPVKSFRKALSKKL
jgi:hypothetical protein